MNAARAAGSVEGGSPRSDRPMKRAASAKFSTCATASMPSFQLGIDRVVANGMGFGCLYSQVVDTRYGTFSSKMFSASSVRPPHVELYIALIGWSLYTAINPRVSVTACVDNGFSVP